MIKKAELGQHCQKFKQKGLNSKHVKAYRSYIRIIANAVSTV